MSPRRDGARRRVIEIFDQVDAVLSQDPVKSQGRLTCYLDRAGGGPDIAPQADEIRDGVFRQMDAVGDCHEEQDGLAIGHSQGTAPGARSRVAQTASRRGSYLC